MKRLAVKTLVGAVSISVVFFAMPLHAEIAPTPVAEREAAAEALFAEARKLMSQGGYHEACDKLKASQ
jgi:hypothetical protein